MTSETSVVAGAVVLCILVWVIWHFFRHQIFYVAYGVDYAQYWLLDRAGFLHDRTGREWMRWTYEVFRKFEYGRDLDWNDLVEPQIDVTTRLRYVYFGLGILTACICAFLMKGDGFRRTYTLTGRAQVTVHYFLGWKGMSGFWAMLLKWPVWTPPFWLYWALTKIKVIQPKKIWMQKGMSFAHYQAQEWKVVLSSAKFDPHKNDPLTAQPKTPMEWLRDENIRLTKREGLDEQGAADAFERQLGPSWQGLEKAPLHVKAIWVLSALNLSRDKRLATIRDRLTEIYSAGGGNTVNEVKALLSPVLKDKKFKTFFLQRGARHAFTNTATIGIYGRCGPMKEWEGGHTGVLPTSNFLWLLPLDRTLFFALNNVGRRSFHIEGAGAIAHYHAERVSGGPMASPQVDHAVDGLIKYLDMQTVTDIQEFFHIEKVFD